MDSGGASSCGSSVQSCQASFKSLFSTMAVVVLPVPRSPSITPYGAPSGSLAHCRRLVTASNASERSERWVASCCELDVPSVRS